MKLPLSQIKIGVRQRLNFSPEELVDLDTMADPEVGLIQPVIVHKELDGYELVAGRRRLAKAESLGWKEIDCIDKGSITPSQKEKMELFEDIGRTGRDWQDVCLAITKIHWMMKQEKALEGESWTIRATALATGYSKSVIHYYLQIADCLKAEPRDEAMWACTGYNEAVKLLVSRANELTRQEQDRRRAIANQQQLLAVEGNGEDNIQSIPSELDIFAEAKAEGEGPVLSEDKTPELGSLDGVPEETVVIIHGYNRSFEDVPLDDFLPHRSHLILVPSSPSQILSPAFQERLLLNVRPEGFIVVWGRPGFSDGWTIPEMTFPLVWNKIALPGSRPPGPYVATHEYGFVFSYEGFKQDWPNQQGNVISAMPEEDGSLPLAVLDFSLCGPPNMPVLCPVNAPVVEIATLGRIPIWYEQDKEKFEAKVKALTEHYERSIPGVKVQLSRRYL
jgi:ParB-like chromosome segregation protein Spo0J